MNVTSFRHKFPEYDDLPDSDIAIIVSDLFSAPESDSKLPEAMMALAEGFKSLEKALAKPVKEKEERRTDYSSVLSALGSQLSKIETAISDFKPSSMPEINIPEPKQVKSLKVKRNELGYITEIIPQY